jgi:EcoEI R protein C-terminal
MSIGLQRDVDLAYVAYAMPPLTREQRATGAKVIISTHFNTKQQVFLDFVLSHYVSVGVDELDQEKLTPLLRLKYHDSTADAVADLGKPERDRQSLYRVSEVSLSGGRVNARTIISHRIAGLLGVIGAANSECRPTICAQSGLDSDHIAHSLAPPQFVQTLS